MFIFDTDREQDVVTDFELGQDRVDISAWGRIYDASSLRIDERWDGADISYGDLTLRLSTEDQTRLTLEDLTNDSFIF